MVTNRHTDTHAPTHLRAKAESQPKAGANAAFLPNAVPKVRAAVNNWKKPKALDITGIAERGEPSSSVRTMQGVVKESKKVSGFAFSIGPIWKMMSMVQLSANVSQHR